MARSWQIPNMNNGSVTIPHQGSLKTHHGRAFACEFQVQASTLQAHTALIKPHRHALSQNPIQRKKTKWMNRGVFVGNA